jgi:hypothetical protein
LRLGENNAYGNAPYACVTSSNRPPVSKRIAVTHAVSKVTPTAERLMRNTKDDIGGR